MNNYLLATSVILLLAGCAGENTDIQEAVNTSSSDGTGPFHECFSSDYNNKIILPEAAYQKGECFLSLALSEHEDGKGFNEVEVGANQHTVLQYANSWYSMAANAGFPLAKSRLSHNQSELYAVESSVLAIENRGYEQLASEKEFNALDADHNGSLSFEEASATLSLAKSFSFSDFDENGKISLAEYIIYTGEATAAGN